MVQGCPMMLDTSKHVLLKNVVVVVFLKVAVYFNSAEIIYLVPRSQIYEVKEYERRKFSGAASPQISESLKKDY